MKQADGALPLFEDAEPTTSDAPTAPYPSESGAQSDEYMSDLSEPLLCTEALGDMYPWGHSWIT